MYSLRPMTEEDQPVITGWLKDDNLRRNITAEMPAPHQPTLAFCLCHNNKVVGMVDLHNCDAVNSKAELGIVIPIRRHRYHNEVKGLITQFIIQSLQIFNRIYCRIQTTNRLTIKLAMHFGFVPEGIERESIVVDGIKKDIMVLSLIRNDIQGVDFNGSSTTVDRSGDIGLLGSKTRRSTEQATA
jgi:RimJ/RimL family protein N-acetyltransferase